MSTFLTMFDSVDVSTVPPNPQAVAGYVGGWWPTFSPLCVKFPHAYHLSIAVNASESADCLDIENGDAVPAQAPGWVSAMMHKGVYRPVVYSSLSEMPAVLDALKRGGVARSEVRLWAAHYSYNIDVAKSELAQGNDGVQWNDHALTRNLDQSLLVADFFRGHKAVVHRNPLNYERFQQAQFELYSGLVVNELQTVRDYDRMRKHPRLHARQLARVEYTLAELAGRIYTVAHREAASNGKPAWAVYWRGWRFQQLIHRAQGHRFA